MLNTYFHGVCYGSRMGVHGFVDRMEEMFDWLPDRADPTWKDCWTEASEIPEFAKRNGRESGLGRLMFNFPRANMIRAFGPENWWEAWMEINAARMRLWGINTIGVGVNNYVDERVQDFLAKAKIPFVVTLKNFPLTKPCIYRDFPDVFSPEYSGGSERFAREQLAPYAGNPYMIGYFITNEPEWLFQDSVNPAERVLAHSGELHSKNALIDFLRGRYADDIGNLATGLVFSPSQTERTKACLFYMERAMAHSCSVGAHYFEWNDQPVLGRFDGECMQHGLISLCNVPYPELTSAMEKLAPRMYRIVAGEILPTTEEGETIGNYS